MAFIPVPGCVQVELRYLLDEQRIENTLYFDAGVSGPAAAMASIGSMVSTWWVANIRPLLSPEIVLNEIYMTDLTTQESSVLSRTTGLPSVGGSTGVPAPNQNALCVSFRSALRGRSGRGRNFVAGLPQASLVSNTWNATLVTNVANGYTALIAAANTNGTPWVIASRYFNKNPRVTGSMRTVVSALCVDGIVDSQRRRTPGRGA